MRTDFEKYALKTEVLTSKEDVLRKIIELKKSTSLEKELLMLNKLEDELTKTNIPRIPLNLDKEEIDSYYIMIDEGKLYKSKLSSFYFEYDNENHELYLSSFTANTEDIPVL